MNLFGNPTPKAQLLTAEAHKLHLAFAVAAAQTIHLLQPVKLNATGELVAAGAADGAHLIIGHSFHDKPEELTYADEMTVIMRGHITCRVQAGVGGLVPGPVKWASWDATNKVNVYVVAADAATTQGHCLDVAAAGAEAEIVLL